VYTKTAEFIHLLLTITLYYTVHVISMFAFITITALNKGLKGVNI